MREQMRESSKDIQLSRDNTNSNEPSVCKRDADCVDLHEGRGASLPGLQNMDWTYSFTPEGTPRDLRSHGTGASGLSEWCPKRQASRPIDSPGRAYPKGILTAGFTPAGELYGRA